MRDEIARNYDRDRTYPPFFKHGREFFQRAKKGEPQAKLYTRIDGREVLLVDPIAIDPTGKTKIGERRAESRGDARGGRHLRARL